MRIDRTWAMPNGNTFKIPPIRELIEKTICENEHNVIVDPFANQCEYGTITNDLNPEFRTTYNMDALEFLKILDDQSADIVLFDPPYSITQAAQLYKSYGKEKLSVDVSNMRYWAECKSQVARILKTGGVAITCGWNTNGVGKERGFKIERILIVAHGGSKNDTLCVVERKMHEIGYQESFL